MTDFLKTHARTIPCRTFGGGWIVPVTEHGERTLEEFFGEEATYLCPIGKTGWIIEPYQVTDLADYLQGI